MATTATHPGVRMVEGSYLVHGGLCVIQRGEQSFHATIKVIYDDLVKVEVVDFSKEPNAWLLEKFSKEDVKPVELYKGNNQAELVESLIKVHRLISDETIRAMREVDRAYFCQGEYVYQDVAVPVGCQSITTTPHMYATTLELAIKQLRNATKVLDVGSGTGNLTALIAHVAKQAHVIGLEYHDQLAKEAEENIKKLPELSGRITFIQGDGEKGYAEGGPYDLITVGFMCKEIPKALLEQLKVGGRLIIPHGDGDSRWKGLVRGLFTVVDKLSQETFKEQTVHHCSYVPSAHSEKYPAYLATRESDKL